MSWVTMAFLLNSPYPRDINYAWTLEKQRGGAAGRMNEGRTMTAGGQKDR